MVKLLGEITKGKRVLILGFGREGRSTYKLLSKSKTHSALAVADKNDIPDKDSFGAEFFIGDDYQKHIDDFDLIFKSPGIVLEDKDILREKITSQTEVFLKKYSEQCIGITGTKGKSTVTTLIYHILSQTRGNAILAGNIGIPPFDAAQNAGEKAVFVCEMSCHQLEYTRVSPHIAVFLNTFEEHLDHYGTYENYVNAKRNIYLHQTSGDVLFCNKAILPEKCVSRVVSLGDDVTWSDSEISCFGDKILFDKNEFMLKGTHNLYNISVAYAVCRELGIKDDEILSAVKTYTPLPHRLEYFGTYGGVKYYDDSISTACETTVQALDTVKDTATLIIGGMDRGIDYTPLVDCLMTAKVNTLICMYDSGKRVFGELTEKGYTGNMLLATDLADAVRIAKQTTQEGMSCVLSPAAASYGFFKNFEERGKEFKRLVREE